MIDTQRRTRLPLGRLAAGLLAAAMAISACGASDDQAADDGKTTATTTAVATDAESTDSGDTDAGDGDDETASDSEAAESDTDESTAPASEARSSRLGDRVLVSDLAATTGRFEGRISISGADDGLPEGIELVFSGAFDSNNDASEISIDLGAIALAAAEEEGTDLGPMAALFAEPMVVRTIGDRSFLSWGLFSLLTGTQGGWIETEAEGADELASNFGATGNGSPVELLTALEDANAEITELGTEDVRGVSTTHIRAVLDISELQAGLTDDERATLERDLGDVTAEALPIEFWIDDDGLVRRYSIDLTEAADADSEIENAGLIFEFYDYGADVDISVPPADQIISADELDLEGFNFGN